MTHVRDPVPVVLVGAASSLASCARRLMQPFEQGGELAAFACGQGRQEAALLLVEYLHGGDLGGLARIRWLDKISPPVARMTLPCHVGLRFEIVEEGHHRGPVYSERIGQRLLSHRR